MGFTSRLLLPLLLTALVACTPAGNDAAPTTLLEAAEQGDLPTMDQHLKGSQMVNMRDACLFTPLMKAALNGHLEAVEKLLKKGAQVDLMDKGGYSAMMLAASNNFHQVVDLLLQSGAEVDRVEHSHGWTALIWASKRGHRETVEVLIQHGASLSITDDSGKSALDHAREKDFGPVVTLLEKAATSQVNIVKSDG